MGKSPGKWLKTLLFGKKTSRSGHAKPKTTDVASSKSKRSSGAEVPTKAAMGAPLPSQPVPLSTHRSISTTEPEKGTLPNVVHEEGAALPVIQDVEILEKSEEAADVIHDLPDAREIQAAVKAQAAFRGYLARRAFQALKGIIRLQGLVRGHLVRRQAVATLLCLQSIIKLQTIIHTRVARHSNLGHAGDGRNFLLANTYFVSKLSASSLIRKILARPIMDKYLSIKYSSEDPNSEWIWLERWTAVCCDGQVIQSKKGAEAKRHRQTAAHSSESELNKVKRSVRTRSHSYNDSISNNSNGTESEKVKRSFKKTSSRPADIVQEQSQNELEKVKRSLRRVSLNSVPDLSADQDGLESEKSKGTSKRTTHPSEPQENADAGDFDDSLKSQTETDFLELAESIETKIYAEPASIDISIEGSQADNLSFPLSLIEVPTPGTPSADSYKDGTQPAINGALNSQSKDDQACLTSKISSKRRSSFPGRVELVENGLQTPTLPSYMAATESAKAKLRAQGSPRFCSDVAEQNGVTRRHSLPSLSNGKIASFSPRTQRLAQPTGKGAMKDRSLLSSRDGTEKAEWRR